MYLRTLLSGGSMAQGSPLMQQMSAKLPTWYRVLTTIVGVVLVVLAFVLLVYPGLALLTLVFLLVFAFLVLGVDRIAAGITGHPFGWMAMMGPPSGTTSTPAPGTTPMPGPPTQK